MPSRRISMTALILIQMTRITIAVAQLPPVKTDTLKPGQGMQGAAGCSATEASSCAQAAAKITPIVM
jgi:hypothetical protein